MMSHAEYVSLQRRRLVEAARAILDGELSLIEGCQSIVSLRWEIDATDEELAVLQPFESVECQTEEFPLGDLRKLYNPKFLSELDRRKSEYLDAVRQDIYRGCEVLIGTISQ